VIHRREGYKNGVICQLDSFSVDSGKIFSGAGLSSNFNSGNLKGRCCSSFINLMHSLNNGFKVFWRNGGVMFHFILARNGIRAYDVLNNMRGVVPASVCDNGGKICHLNGGHRNLTLTNSVGNGSSGIPTVFGVAVGPVIKFGIRYKTTSSCRKVISEKVSKPETAKMLLPAITPFLRSFIFFNSSAIGNGKIRVATICNGANHIQR